MDAPQAGAGADSGWLAETQRMIADSEYEVSQAKDRAPFAGSDPVYQAPNRAHNLRTYFTRIGIRVDPRTDDSAPWEWSLTLAGVGRRGTVATVSEAVLKVHGHEVEYLREELREWYRNGPRGLEQGFTLEARPADEKEAARTNEVVIEMELAGTLSAFPTEDGQAIEFRTPAGERAIKYAELQVTDATGIELPAHLEALNRDGRRTIVIVWDDKDAIYPITVDPLATSPSWSMEIGQAGALLGVSVATAGDVNGDGYSDVVVGAYGFDNGQTNEGRAYLFKGSASGPLSSVGWMAEGNQTSSRFGFSVATAGDVNGDGYSDVIVGAYGYDDGQTDEGRAYVYQGSASGLGASEAWSAESDQAGAFFGVAVAPAGDVNGDGYSDVLVGAQLYDGGQTDEGRAYAYYGSSSGLSATPGWTAETNFAGSQLGVSLSTAGDVNGDGFADVIVGAFEYGLSGQGAAFVYHGSAGGLGTVPVRTLSNAVASAAFGNSVSTAGDVDGDGYSDVIVGAYHLTNGQTEEGQALVYRGSATGVQSTPVWTVESNEATAQFGVSVATAGDINGDGYADIVVGARLHDSAAQTDAGAAYLYLGSPTGPKSAASWTGEGTQAAEEYGGCVATAGDVNGDGYADVIVGAQNYTNGQSQEGWAGVYLGSASGQLTTSAWAFDGSAPNDLLGSAVATAGDVNGDGYSDIILGALGFDGAVADAGKVYLFLGSASGPSTVPTWTVEGDVTRTFLGGAVAAAGDVDGDGYGDVIVGAGDANGQAGRAFVYLGTPTGLESIPTWNRFGTGTARYGYSVASAGDVNGDGYSDILVGAPEIDDPEVDEGAAYLYLGSPSGPPLNPDWTVEGNLVGARLGACVAGAGDVNRDGYSDILLGISDGTNEMGEARVYLGSRSGAATSPIWSVQGTQIGEELGTPVAGAGDVNGDGYADVIVGAASHDGPLPGAGLAMVFLGSAAGVGTSPAWSYSVSQTNARFGTSVASAGDLNADGYSDILVGASGLDFGGRTDAGAAYVFLGAPTGPAPGVSTSVVGAANGFTLGTRVSTAGDVNGDGYSDILVTAGGYNSLAGRSYLYYGNGGPGVPLVPGQHRTAGALPIVPLLASDEPDRFGLSLVGRTPFGRGKVRLEYEVKTLTTLLNGSSTILSDPADTTVAGVALNATSTGLLPGVVYHWRSRLRYSAVTSPLALRSRWLTQPWNSQQEADLRIRGEAGEVPPGSLRIQKLNTFMMKLSWEPSCKSGDFDYAIYEGRIGSWYSHNSLICSTAGTLWQDINYNTPRLHLGDHYFLVVPIGTAAEGSYGRDSHGNEIPAGGRVCNVQEAVACP